MERVMVIGAAGQIGSELVAALRLVHGNENVFATDIKDVPDDIKNAGPSAVLDVMDDKRLIHYVIRHKITQIYHLAAVLSGNAEKLPLQAWHINMQSLMNILDLAKVVEDIKKVFWPSSIAVFGPTTPRVETPQLTITEPSTVYGISKLAGERWCEYFYNRYNVDVRSIRYPGLISYKTEAGGGTTDYAVEIFYEAIKTGKYECFLKDDTALPMMFMEDAVNATIKLMESPKERITIHSSYNVGGISFTPKQLSEEIKKHIPDFEISYKPDFRQPIADSWPQSINDKKAQKDWGLETKYDIKALTEVMLKGVKKKFGK
ncbi:MAG: NAD-dependent epimerase/dehydratase family protein [Bacteroidales bacterium]|nr:NAD-dependent epimerase/dehydratase family protein [Bacteroidales bacterium]